MPKRKRRQPIATIAGQSGNIAVKGSRYNILREPDTIRVHGGGEERNLRMEGREHHIHVHAQAAPGTAPRPERPQFDFNILGQQLMQTVQRRAEKEPINLAGIKKPEFISRWRGRKGEGVIIRNLADLKKADAKSWLIIHPLMLLDAMVTSKGAIGGRVDIGRRGFRRATRQDKRALALRKKYAPGIERLYRNFEAEAKAALESLAEAVESDKVTWENRNHYMQNYENAVRQAEHNFTAARIKLLDAYAAEWKK